MKEAKEKLINYIESQAFKGYDPYDTLNSPFPFYFLGKWGPVLAIQLQKRNPFNIRKLLGIKKEYNPKAIGLLLHAYSLQYQKEQNEECLKKMHFFFNWLLENRSKGYTNFCWGYNFDWASPLKFLEKYSPTIVVSGFISKGIFEYFIATKDEKAKEVLISIGEFVKNDLAWTSTPEGKCVSYSTKTIDCCYNASMLGAELFARLYFLTKDESYKTLATSLTNFTVAHQQTDGSWNYSIDMETGKERQQIDFHQGYVLDSIHYVLKYIGENSAYFEALKQGATFYYEKQFLPNGQSVYRYPDKYPVEIHNQAQSIITFSRLAYLDEQYTPFAKKIAEYTIATMQHPHKGYFYYKKYPLYTIKTPFMRWSQAWMLLALTELSS